MGYADLLLMMKFLMVHKKSTRCFRKYYESYWSLQTEDESIKLGQEKGIPEECKKLPVPRRNIVCVHLPLRAHAVL